MIRDHADRMESARMRGDKYRIAVLGRARSAAAIGASALRKAAIPFRAVELESLADRAEVLDALALARALLNGEDRAAWLGVLRAPWCGLSLKDLHTLAGADDADVLRRPLPELLNARMSLLSAEGQKAVARVVQAIEAAPRLRTSLPTASLGTWLEQVWLGLGGADCVDAAARANLDLLWSALDRLPEGEPDLLGSGLAAALARLTAQPDPTASSSCGVQVMTIHKSKGLEFEVVIVAELQAGCGSTRGTLLSWLERGVASADDSPDATEFLVAPIPPKGADRGKAKEWVDHMRSEREAQETRRILYVATTRAREELHLFARPHYKVDQGGESSLCEPSRSLLSTAWPALENEVRARFESWKAERQSANIESIAAGAGNNVIEMPTPGKPALVRRLPANYERPLVAIEADRLGNKTIAGSGDDLYTRHQGGIVSRALGTAVHRLFEELARLL